MIDAFDLKLLKDTIRSLLAGKPTAVPEWDSSNHTRYNQINPNFEELMNDVYIERVHVLSNL